MLRLGLGMSHGRLMRLALDLRLLAGRRLGLNPGLLQPRRGLGSDPCLRLGPRGNFTPRLFLNLGLRMLLGPHWSRGINPGLRLRPHRFFAPRLFLNLSWSMLLSPRWSLGFNPGWRLWSRGRFAPGLLMLNRVCRHVILLSVVLGLQHILPGVLRQVRELRRVLLLRQLLFGQDRVWSHVRSRR